ncbi:MAG: 50S ribosomal protein L13e [Thaumarchaeota archaeon]|nr:50S ribosomal protein L13e [Nitrososphaerota archaeon]
MSKKPAARKPKEKAAEKKPKMQKPSAPAPVAKISTWELKERFRSGRGFSMQELKEANISLGMARKLGLYVDIKRSTKREENISALKSWLK